MAIFGININGYVNQPPSQVGNNTVIVNHNVTTIMTLANFTTETNPPYLDPEGDALQNIRILSINGGNTGTFEYNGNPLIVGDIISSADLTGGLLEHIGDSGTLTSYNDSFTFEASDIGSGNYTGTGTFTVSVNAYVNQPPTTGDNAITIDYAEQRVLTTAEFTTGTTPAYSDPEGDAALNLRVNTLPSQGILRLNGVNVTINQVIPFTSITGGLFTYTANASTLTAHSVNFDFDIQDAGSGQFSS